MTYKNEQERKWKEIPSINLSPPLPASVACHNGRWHAIKRGSHLNLIGHIAIFCNITFIILIVSMKLQMPHGKGAKRKRKSNSTRFPFHAISVGMWPTYAIQCQWRVVWGATSAVTLSVRVHFGHKAPSTHITNPLHDLYRI